MIQQPRLPADVSRCVGVQADGVWRDGCEDCLRRTAPPVHPDYVWRMDPPTVIVFECHARIAPRTSKVVI
jgi:hypothetical protein